MLNSLTIALTLTLSFPAAISGLESAKLSADQRNLIEDTRVYALRYVKQLPDFVCTQITHRNVSGVSSDTIEEELTFMDGKESYTVLTLNGKTVTNAVHSQMNGAISWGEFGSLLSQVLDPASKTIFSWDREEEVDGRRGWAFKYHVPRESGATLVEKRNNEAIVVPYFGRVVIDPETKEVVEISSVLEIPPTFRIQNVTRKIVYRDQEIAGKKFCLPLHSEVHMEERGRVFDNRIEFKDYHHFSSSSIIHFGPTSR